MRISIGFLVATVSILTSWSTLEANTVWGRRLKPEQTHTPSRLPANHTMLDSSEGYKNKLALQQHELVLFRILRQQTGLTTS